MTAHRPDEKPEKEKKKHFDFKAFLHTQNYNIFNIPI